MESTAGLRRDWASSGQPAALSLLLFFSFPPHSLFLSSLFKERKIGKFLQATLLQVSVGFKHAHWGFGTVHVSAVVSDSALYRGWHFVTIGEVSFCTALFFSCLFWDSLESKKEEGGAEFCWERQHLERTMWKSLSVPVCVVCTCRFLCSFFTLFYLSKVIMLHSKSCNKS